MSLRSWAVQKVWGDDKYAGEPLPALNAMRRDGLFPIKPNEMADTKINEGNGHALRVIAHGLADNLLLVIVRDHGNAKYVALAQDNGQVSA